MRIAFLIQSFIWPKTLSPQSLSPKISLTSQDGVWIRTEDFIHRRNLLLLFVNDLYDPKNISWLRLFDQLEIPETSIFVVNHLPTKTLREIRDKEDLKLDILYDPLSIEARRFGMGHRRFKSKTGALLIGANQLILTAILGHPTPDQLHQGNQPNKSEALNPTELNTTQALALMKKGHILVDVRTFSEYEAHYAPQAIHIPIEELTARMDELPQKNNVIFICQAGERALAAAELMRALGSKDISVVAGGMTRWNGPQQHGVSNS